MTFRLGILASGAGTNLQALIDAIATGALPATIAGVFSDKAQAVALDRARVAGVPAFALSPKAFASREDFDAAFFAEVDAAGADLIVCAGYMRIISAAEIRRRPGRMINLHPSLLPAFKGLHTHRQALEAGVAEHGASVHVVTADLDDGPVIARAPVPVLPGDDEAALAARVREVEHPLLVETVRLFAEGRLRLDGTTILMNGGILTAPLQLRANRRLA
jgi:phosphoribosylglycinamide formyltransferase-1